MSEQVYAVRLSRSAGKQLARLVRSVQTRILKALALLELHPKPPAARRLSVESKCWRIRVGDYRVIYTVDEGRLLIAVVRIAHRSSADRNIALS